MARTKININALQGALDAARDSRGMSWRQLAKEIGVSPSLLSRLNNGYRPDADGFATLVSWLGLPAETFFVDEDKDDDGTADRQNQPDLMAQMAPLLRAQKELNADDVAALEDVMSATLRLVKARRERQ